MFIVKIPDLEINGRPLDEGPLAGKIFLADVKTLSPCDAYTDNQTGEPNAAVNARQKRVNLDYHAKAQRLDEHYGCNESHGFKARLNSHGRDELELELIQTQMTQKPMLRAEVGMRVRCAKQASIE